MKKQTMIYVLLLMLLIVSCKKIDDTVENSQTMNELVISDNFDWETFRDIEVRISLEAEDSQAKSKVSIFNDDPATYGKLMVSGNVSTGSTFISSMRIPKHLTHFFIKLESPFAGTQIVDVPITGNSLIYTFDTKMSDDIKNFLSDPECNEVGDIIVTQTTGTLDIENGKIYSIDHVFDGVINFKNTGGTLKICGTVTTSNVNLNKDSHHLIVTQGGSFTADDLGFSAGGTITIYSNSTLTVNNEMSARGNFINYGDVNIKGTYNSNDGSFKNYGNFIVDNNMTLNSSDTAVNGCKIICDGNFKQNAGNFKMLEDSYLEANNISFIHSKTFLCNGAMVKCDNYSSGVQNQMFGTGTRSLIVVNNTVDIKGDVDGEITVVYDQGSNVTVTGTLTNGAVVSLITDVTDYIPQSSCNPVGFIIDTDLDGVPDELDLYPNDSSRATNSYFPAKDVWGTVVFEDLWPSKGDYDFNDMVLDFTGYYVLNAQNHVKDFIVDFQVRAVGASLKNGFGFQLDQITPDQVENVSGYIHESSNMTISLNANGTESNQTKAVVIVVSTVESIINRAPGSMFNTVKDNTKGTWDVTTVTVTFLHAIVQSSVGLQNFNPFLIKNQDRTVEIHLRDMVPTDLINQSNFKTFEDDSFPAEGKYYRTSSNLLWGIMLMEQFDYPYESVEIIDAYVYFSEWCQSGGIEHVNWYTDEPGNRIPENIYH